jgi:hypothetical protein
LTRSSSDSHRRSADLSQSHLQGYFRYTSYFHIFSRYYPIDFPIVSESFTSREEGRIRGSQAANSFAMIHGSVQSRPCILSL